MKISRFRFLLVFLAGPLFISEAARAQQNVTVVAVDPSGRLTNSTVLGEWVTAGNLDSWTGANVSNLASSSGLLTGDDLSASADGAVSRTAISGGPDLDLGFNDYLQIRIMVPAGYTNAIQIEYGTTVNTGFASTRKFVIPAASIPKDGAFHTYRLAMGLEVWWRDTLRDLRITPLLSATGHFEIDYVEVGDVAGTEPALNLDTNFSAGINVSNTTRLIGKHVCVWWVTTNASFTMTHARRAVRMCEESFQVYCNKLGYSRPFCVFGTTNTPEYKINYISWYGGYWAGGYNNRGHMNVDSSGLADEGSGNPVPHEFGHVVQMGQLGNLAGGHWESHANYLRAGRNLHFYAVISGAVPGLDNLTGNSNYRPDHKRHIYADQRYYLSLDDYGTQFGLPANYAAVAWRDGASGLTLIEKLAPSLPAGVSVKDVACESMKRWPMLDFVEKTKIRAQHWSTTSDKAYHFWKQGAQLIPLPDKSGWWRVPLERAPDCWGYQMHDLTASAGATITAELRGLDMPGTGEDWRWCFAAISAGDNVRYSSTFAPGTQSFTLNTNETQVFLIVTATPDSTPIDLESLSNTKPIDKHADRLRYAYEVRLVNAVPASHQFSVSNPANYHLHSNGGGVVGPSATVASTAYVGPNAKVIGSAKVLSYARIEDYAVVQGSATVQGNAVVSGSALVESSASVSENARVRDRAWLGGGAIVKGRALVGGYTQVENTTVMDDAIVRGCAYPFGGKLSGTAIADHDYSMDWTVTNGVQFSHIPWGGWWNDFYAQTVAKPRGLAASYRTEETSGEEWWDEFGALHALLRGSPVRSFDSTLGSQVISFDGTNSYALLDRSVADTPAFSFSCWVKPANPIGIAEPILFFGTNATRALKLARDASGKAALTIGNGTNTSSLTSTSTLPQNVWSHIAFKLDGTNACIYIAGTPQARLSTSFTPLTVLAPNSYTTAHPHYVGRDFAGALFKGSLDDVRFYNVAMTDAEVRQECFRKGDMIGLFSPVVATDFVGTNSIVQSGVRNGRLRTLSAWVKPRTSDDVSNYEAVFDSYDEQNNRNGNGIGLDAGKWILRIDGYGRYATAVSAQLNKWQHITLTLNGSTAILYTNGVQAASRTYTGPSSDSAAAGKCFRIGFSQTGDATTRQYFDGQIAMARIHDRALTAAQIVLDTDGDGIRDDIELDSGTNPLDAASFVPPPIIIASAGTNGSINPSGSVQVNRGDDQSFTISANLGYAITNVTVDGVSLGALSSVTFTNVTTNHTISASFVVTPPLTITATAGTNGTISPSGSVQVSSGANQAFTVSPNMGYVVSGVLVDGVGQGAITNYTFTNVTVNHTIAATFAVYTVPPPIALYQFETNVLDSMGNYNGTAYGSPTYVAGKLGNYAIKFNGSSQYVTIPRPVSDNFTIAFWVKSTQASLTGTQWYNGSGLVDGEVGGTANDFGITYLNSKVAFGVGNPDTTLQSASTINSGNWVHVACTRDSASGQMKIYINGVLETTGTGPTGTRSAPATLHLGNLQTTTKYFNGSMDQVRIYNSVLSATDINYLASEVTVYTIAATAGGGGTINPSGSLAVNSGSNQVFTIAPLTGFDISNVTVDGVNQGAISGYTFTNVTANHTISAAFALTPPVLSASGFTLPGGIPHFTIANTLSGHQYTLVYKNNLTDSSWTPLSGSGTSPGNGGTITLIDTNSISSLTQRFYRIVLQ